MKAWAFTCLLAIFPVGCAHAPHVKQPTCAEVCAYGVSLSCSWATPTSKGATCEQVCLNAAAVVPWNISCLIATPSCEPAACP